MWRDPRVGNRRPGPRWHGTWHMCTTQTHVGSPCPTSRSTPPISKMKPPTGRGGPPCAVPAPLPGHTCMDTHGGPAPAPAPCSQPVTVGETPNQHSPNTPNCSPKRERRALMVTQAHTRSHAYANAPHASTGMACCTRTSLQSRRVGGPSHGRNQGPRCRRGQMPTRTAAGLFRSAICRRSSPMLSA